MPIKPESSATGSGATFKQLDDGSLLAEGIVSTTDTYELTLRSDQTALTGLRLEVLRQQLANLLKLHDLDVKIRVVDDNLTNEMIKAEIVQNLSMPDDYVLVNYTRKALDQKGGGHISPVAAYDNESDLFLVMDVNPNRAFWIWIKSADLIGAMKTFDTIENRGYLLISEKKPTQ